MHSLYTYVLSFFQGSHIKSSVAKLPPKVPPPPRRIVRIARLRCHFTCHSTRRGLGHRSQGVDLSLLAGVCQSWRRHATDPLEIEARRQALEVSPASLGVYY